MCEAIQQMLNDERAQGKEQGSLNEKRTIARRMLEMKFPEEQIVTLTKLTAKEVEKLSKTVKN